MNGGNVTGCGATHSGPTYTVTLNLDNQSAPGCSIVAVSMVNGVGSTTDATWTTSGTVSLPANASYFLENGGGGCSGVTTSGWTGCDSLNTNGNPCTITMNSNKTISVTNTSNLPSAPRSVAAAPGNAQATVTFGQPINSGTITGYTVTSSPGNITATGTASPITVTGLTNGTSYTFTVTATNTSGTGPASSASNSVIPSAAMACSSNPTGIVSWWKAELNANDQTGLNNGTTINGASYAPGKIGEAFSFNGANQYVFVPNSPSLNVTNQFTLQAWVNPSSMTWTGVSVISKVGGPGGTNGYQMAIAPSNSLLCQFNANGEAWPTNAVTAGVVQQNVWTHISCTDRQSTC